MLIQLKNDMDELEYTSPNAFGRFFYLIPHKKKAILATIPKIPSATGSTYSITSIKNAFVLNHQLDVEQKSVPCLNEIL